MATDIGPGDLVVCVDAGHVNDPGTPNANLLVAGRVYQVASLGWPSEWAPDGEVCRGVIVRGVRSYNRDGSFHPSRFRKLNDEPDDAELIARIKDCRPTPAKERVG